MIRASDWLPRGIGVSLAAAMFSVWVSSAHATDSWFYKSLLVGERASGLGGAYAAIADDPSGVWYNPAGLAMGQESYLSGSVNAYQTGSVTYDELFPGESYRYQTQGLIPSFFGFTQQLGPVSKLGFILMVRDSLSQEQDDELSGLEVNDTSLTSITRQLIRTRSSYVVGPGLSVELSSHLMVGFSGFAVYQSERYLDQQRALYIDPDDAERRLYQLNQTYLSRDAWGLMPKLGILYVPIPRLSLGVTAAKTFSVSGKGRAKGLSTTLDDSGIPAPSGDFETDFDAASYERFPSRVLAPWELSFAAAWFPSDSWILSTQLDYQTADSDFSQYAVQPSVNLALGVEWAEIQQFPLRVGVFTNNSNTPTLVSGATDQKEHVDQLGVSAGLSWMSPGSSISLSGSYQWGLGEGQILSGQDAVQDVRMESLTLFLSGSYQL